MPITIPISQIMTKEVVSVDPGESLDEIESLFKKHSFHPLPVLNANGEIVGLISKDNFSRLAFLLLEKITAMKGKSVVTLKAEDIMDTAPVILSARQKLDEAIQLFLQNKAQAVLIAEEGALQGILTTYDVTEALYRIIATREEDFVEVFDNDHNWEALWENYFE